MNHIFPGESKCTSFQDSAGLTVSCEQKSRMGGPQVVIWAKSFDLGILAHEASHFAFELMNKVGIPVSSDTEEFHCYTTQWVMSHIQYAMESPIDDSGDMCERVKLTEDD
jgi:hypothetical protein